MMPISPIIPCHGRRQPYPPRLFCMTLLLRHFASASTIEKEGSDIEDKVNIQYYLGVNIEEQDHGKIRQTHPHIIDSIINDAHIPNNTVTRQTPALSTKIIWRDTTAPPFCECFNYRSVAGKLSFLENITIPDIA